METPTTEIRPDTGQSPAIAKLAAALAAAQGEFTNPPKSKTVHAGARKYSFAPLPEIIDVVRPVLAKHRLAVVQLVSRGALDTRLLHESGQSIGAVYPLPEIADSQAMGSAITYARRYALCAMLGIAAEDDEDGQAATDAEQEAEEAKRQEAKGRLDALKAKGKLKSAYDGHTLQPGEDVKPQDDPKPAAETKPVEPEPEGKAIANPLADLMKRDGVTAAQVKAFYVGKGHLPKTVEPQDLPSDYVAVITKPDNWKKAVSAMKGAK